MHGLVTLDKNNSIIRSAILWNDGHTFKEVDYLNNIIGKDKLPALTANIAFAGFTVPKIIWMRQNEPENFQKIANNFEPKDLTLIFSGKIYIHCVTEIRKIQLTAKYLSSLKKAYHMLTPISTAHSSTKRIF